MPRFEPFPGLRYAADPYPDVIAPPYDVLSERQAAQYRDHHRHNIAWIDLPSGGDPYGAAGRRYRQWRRDGVLVSDDGPTLTIYRLNFTDPTGTNRSVAGVLGGLEVADEGSSGIFPHERTTPKASTDRLDLTRATAANLSPVWGLSLARGLTELLAAPAEHLGSVIDDGVEHVVERISDPDRITAIARLIGSDDLLVADGHHRYGVARTYRDEMRDQTGRRDTPAEYTLTFVNELVSDQLSVRSIHRLYTGISLDNLHQVLAQRFDLEPIDRPTPDTLAAMEAKGFLVLVGPDRSWSLTPKPGAFDDTRALDGAWLEATLADLRPAVTYQHGLDEVLAAVDSGEATAGVLIRPVTVDEIERTAREGVLMPPKSTFFTPKLKTGFVLRPMND
jgi:uncharacterized protein (DUF1015 family)